MVFFSGYSGFPIYPLRCLELDFCSSFSKVGLNLRHVVYLRFFLHKKASAQSQRRSSCDCAADDYDDIDNDKTVAKVIHLAQPLSRRG